MAGSAWTKVKAVLTQRRATSPCAEVLVTGPEPMIEPGRTDRERGKKRAMLLSGLVEAASRRGRRL